LECVIIWYIFTIQTKTTKAMTKVWFRCDRKNDKMFVLNSMKEMDYVPMVGDIISTNNDDFQRATFRIKPWIKEKGISKNFVYLEFEVVSRTYSTGLNEWSLICKPTADSLLFLLKNISTR
jgi:hypothetical protein